MNNKKLQKTVVYVMLFAMITSTIMMGLSMFL
ncbi:stressosome-associated protein Prli42 [Rossellomorea vietnamensis]|nr:MULTISPECIES: stressosome-associated protein Prli42 [Bacillaceae]